MPDDPETVPMTPAVEQPPVTRLRVALQTLARLRDGYTRDKTPVGRLEAARAMAERTNQIGALAAEVLAEAERAASAPTDRLAG